MVKILIVEDDAAISNLIEGTFMREGFHCICAMDGEEGLARFDESGFDLVLLDLMLPKYSGYELLEYIQPTSTPVIILSAMGQVQDRIKGLKMGADDYLVKPFQIGELLARIESVLRRTQRNTRLTCRDVMVDPEARMVWKAGEKVDLTVKEFDLLVVLLRHSNVALTRGFLYEQVWAEEYTGETRTLDNHIQRLRKKLSWMNTIQTVPRMGYRLWNPGMEET
ncbi:MAG: response regulator transcription factor [Lachnospiraceae bacterium]|nr:response regulator transcription factor [Lachnospiraceae bacterium]